ncbi:serum response factor-like [Octopus sinensis]|uniref:Serum response factor-like n=1 Tax=Octopus sinensis TaxID=2607531 RepID=A0A6P7SR20_9MOLL|nr:serum response factor-like [Octopus sinensis]
MQNSNHCETLTVSQYVHSDNITNGSRLLVDQSVFKTSGIASTAPSGADSKHLSLAPGSRMQTTMVSTHSNNELGDDNSDSDSESDCIGNDLHLQSQSHQQNQSQHQVRRPPDGLKPGKKTKGRVKIKMEFIQNKLRRYTTFSKRKTGIMKKAYELSTLTGTQVMLLVASETGHVYTFATRKLQPMITSDSGKALIQTCLNSPDTSADGPSHQQRMNPTGFEETELTYSVEDENKADLKPLLAQMPGDQVLNRSQLIGNAITSSPPPPQSTSLYVTSTGVGQNQLPLASLVPSTLSTIPSSSATTTKPVSVTAAHATTASTHSTTSNGNTNTNISMQVSPSLTAILQPGTQFTIPFQQGTQQIAQTAAAPVYRLPNTQVVSIANISGNTSNNTNMSSPTTVTSVSGETLQLTASASTTSPTSVSTSTNNTQNQTVNLMSVPATAQHGTTSATTMTPGFVMYQTPQGVVYAAPTLPDGSLLNFQPSAALQSTDQNNGTQQIITLPMPLSSPVLQFATTDTTNAIAELSQPKKARK